MSSHGEHNFNPNQEQNSSKQYVETGKQIAQSYFQFFIKQLKAPTAEILLPSSTSVHLISRTWPLHSLITIALIILLTPTVLYVMFRGFLSFGVSFGLGVSPAKTLFFTPLFYLLLLFVAKVGIMYGITKLMKVETSIQNVIDRFGKLLVIPVATLLVAVLLSFTQSSLTMNLLTISMVLVIIAAAYTLYSFRNENGEGLDPFIGTVVLIISTGILVQMFFRNIISFF